MKGVPFVAAVLNADRNDAYSLEWHIDPDWAVEFVLLASHEVFDYLSDPSGITSLRNVFAGVTDLPLKEGVLDPSPLARDRNNWLLVGGPGSQRSETTDRAKIHAALGAGGRVVLCFDEIGTEQLPLRLAGLTSEEIGRVVLAYVGSHDDSPTVSQQVVQFVRGIFENPDCTVVPRLIVGGAVTAATAQEHVGIEGVCGVFLAADRYEDYSHIIKVMEALDQQPNSCLGSGS